MEEKITGAVEAEALITERGERQVGREIERERERERERDLEKAHRGWNKKNTYPKLLTGNMKGADYREFLQQAQFKDWSFKNPCHG